MILYEVFKTMCCEDNDRIVLKNTKGENYLDFKYGGRDWIAPVLLASKVKNIKAVFDTLVITLEDLSKEAH